MRIAFVIDRFDPAKGGAERWIALLLETLSSRGHSIDLCAMSWTGSLPGAVRPVRVSAPPFPRPVRDLVFARRAAALLERLEPDVSVSLRHFPDADVFLALGGLHRDALRASELAGGSGLRVVLHALSPKHRALLRLEDQLFDRSDSFLVIAPSPLVEARVKILYPRSEARISVIPHGVDTDRFRPAGEPARSALRKKLGFEDTDVAAVFVAHNFRLKGLPFLIDAWRELGPSFRLRVIGRGRPPRAARRARGIEFSGERKDVLEHLQAADLLVHPTFHDPFPLAVVEALACGLPVVTTKANGIAGLMRQGVEGYIIDDARDVTTLADRIRRFDDRDLARRLGQGARKLAETLVERDLLERTAEAIEEEGRRLSRAAPVPPVRSASFPLPEDP